MNNEKSTKKKKIVVLGGGMSALSAAFELTDYKGWNDHYDITLYQMGWRLGGKCATGRGLNDRIEEHGIHIFLGFYNNAIRMIRLAYQAWRRHKIYAENQIPEHNQMPKDHPFQEWESVFHHQTSIMLPEYSKDEKKWLNWSLVFPENDDVPGESDGPPSHHTNIKKMILLMLELILGSPYQLDKNRGCLGGFIHRTWEKVWTKPGRDILPEDQPNSNHWSTIIGERPSSWEDLKSEVEKRHGHKRIDQETKYLHHAREIAQSLPENKEQANKQAEALGPDILHAHEKIVMLLEQYIIEVEGKIIHKIKNDNGARRFWILAQLALVNFRGLNADCYDQKTGTYNFDKINDYEFRDWLKKWGASEEVANSSPVKDIYTLVFAYPNGDTTKNGAIAAGTAVQGAMLIILGYKGSVMYRFHGGTAEVIASPLYNVLKARGVKFKFFHEVEQVHYSDSDKNPIPDKRNIERITIKEQIKLKPGRENFEPNRRIKGLLCWPSHPFWQWNELADQIDMDDLDALKKGNINLESAWSGWKGGTTKTLKIGEDFDQVILGISIDGLKGICKEIIEKKYDWSQMVENVLTVQTQAVQLWLKKDLTGLGMNLSELGLSCADNPVLDTYVDPINSYADMSELLRWESWPAENQAENSAYFCGPMTQSSEVLPPHDDTSFPEKQYQRVVDMAKEWFNSNTGFLWPAATTKTNPQGLDLELLNDPQNDTNSRGEQKFERQFFRANIDPSERYVLSVPGSNKYRKKADESGYYNLFLAGDWVDTGYNMGCVECAVMSGLMAAQALRKTYGFIDHKPILKDL